jgi:hypothetical protein
MSDWPWKRLNNNRLKIMLKEMLACSSHEKIQTHTSSPTYTYLPAYIHVHNDHTQSHMYTNILHTDSELGKLWWRPRMGACLCTTKVDWATVTASLSSCSLPHFWNEPCVLVPLSVHESGKTSALQLDLASWKRLLFNFGSLHSVCHHWCSCGACEEREGEQLKEREKEKE